MGGYQVEQPTVGKVLVWPTNMIVPTPAAFTSFPTFAEN